MLEQMAVRLFIQIKGSVIKAFYSFITYYYVCIFMDHLSGVFEVSYIIKQQQYWGYFDVVPSYSKHVYACRTLNDKFIGPLMIKRILHDDYDYLENPFVGLLY